MHKEYINGKEEMLGDNEILVDWKCPECGGDIITNYGPGISISFCTHCGYEDEDYDF